MNRYLYYIAVVSLFTFAGCSEENPIDIEQYFKQIYLVGAADKMTDREVSYSEAESEISVSVAASGSLNLDKDVSFKLTEDAEGIGIYNRQNLSVSDIQYQALPISAYSYPSESAVVKAGEIYAKFPIKVRASGLHCDSLYVIPLKIASVSDYTIAKDTILLVRIKPVNTFSGEYFAIYEKKIIDGVASPSVGMYRNLTAVDANTVRMIHEVAEDFGNVATNGILLRINADKTLAVTAWDSFDLIDGGGSYDEGNKSFRYWYEYNSGAIQYRVEGVLVSPDSRETN